MIPAIIGGLSAAAQARRRVRRAEPYRTAGNAVGSPDRRPAPAAARAPGSNGWPGRDGFPTARI
eukprot:314358-Hanusia_phi.AAC.2